MSEVDATYPWRCRCFGHRWKKEGNDCRTHVYDVCQRGKCGEIRPHVLTRRERVSAWMETHGPEDLPCLFGFHDWTYFVDVFAARPVSNEQECGRRRCNARRHRPGHVPWRCRVLGHEWVPTDTPWLEMCDRASCSGMRGAA